MSLVDAAVKQQVRAYNILLHPENEVIDLVLAYLNGSISETQATHAYYGKKLCMRYNKNTSFLTLIVRRVPKWVKAGLIKSLEKGG